MPSRPWFRWYEGDYIADTLHLTETQDLIYRRLLGVLWIYGPQPEELGHLARICRIHKRKFSNNYAIIKPLLSINNGLVDHQKLSKQRQELVEISEKRAEAGRKGGKANAKANASTPRARAQPDPDPEKDLPPPLYAPPTNRRSEPKPAVASFEDFWKCWPKKVSKGQAAKTWAKLAPDATLAAEIHAGLERAKREDERFRNGYTPHASTWLNARGWEDEHSCKPMNAAERLRRQLEKG